MTPVPTCEWCQSRDAQCRAQVGKVLLALCNICAGKFASGTRRPL